MSIQEIFTFTNFLNEMDIYDSNGDPGSLLDVMNREIAHLAIASRKSNKESCLTLTLSLVPSRNNEMFISGTVKAKEPSLKALPLTAFTDNRGRLYSEDPYQQKLDFTTNNIAEINNERIF